MCNGCKWYGGHCFVAIQSRVCGESEMHLAKRLGIEIQGLQDRPDYGTQWPRHYDPKNVITCNIREAE